MKQSKAVITEDFEVIFDSVMAEVSRRLRCNTLARVVEVDGKLLTVQPIIQERINTPNGSKYVKLPIIKNVYCISSQTPQVNDYVACLHFDRGIGNFDIFNNIDGFIESGTHRHDLSDCVAVVIDTKSNEQERIGEYNENTTITQLKECSEVKVVIFENGSQIGTNTFCRSDGTSINIKLPQEPQGTAITLDLNTGAVNIPLNYSVAIYTKK